MARGYTGVSVTSGGGVEMRLEPPLDFVLKQSGAFRRQLEHFELWLWPRFKDAMSDIERDQFASQGHGAWPELAESTLERKRNDPSAISLDPLIRTGDLRESLVNPARAAETGPGFLAWRSDVPYAGHHQDPEVPGRPPQRKVIDLRIEDRRRLEREMVTGLNLVAARTWGRV